MVDQIFDPDIAPPPQPLAEAPISNLNDFTNKMANVVGANESGNRYLSSPNTAGAMGRYQFTRGRLNDLGYSNVSNQQFIQDPTLQDNIFKQHVSDIVDNLGDRGYINQGTPQNVVGGLVMAAHLGGMGGVDKLIGGQGGQVKDSLGTSIQDYFNRGSAAFSGGSVSLNTSYRQQQANTPLADIPGQDDTSQNIFSPVNSRQSAMSSGGLNVPSNLTPAVGPIPGLFDGFGDSFSGSNASAFDSTNAGMQDAIEGQIKKYESDLTTKFGVQNPNLMARTSPFAGTATIPGVSQPTIPQMADSFNQQVERIQAANPGVKLPITNFDDILNAAGSQIQQESAAADQAYKKAGSIGGVLGSLAGGMTGWIRDPMNALGSTMLGPGVLAQGLGMAGIEGTQQLLGKQSTRKSLGLESGLVPAAKEIGESAAGGIVGGAIIKGLGKIMGAAADKVGSLWSDTGKNLAETGTPVGEALGAKAQYVGGTLEQNPLDSVNNLDAALGHTADSVLQDKPIDTYNLVANDIQYKPLQPMDRDLAPLVPQELGEPEDLMSAGDRIMQEANEQVAANPGNYPNIGDRLNDILPAKIEENAEVELPKATTDISPIVEASEPLIQQEAIRQGIDLNTNPELRDGLLDAVKVDVPDKNGVNTTQTLRQVQEDAQQNQNFLKEFNDCIGKNSPVEDVQAEVAYREATGTSNDVKEPWPYYNAKGPLKEDVQAELSARASEGNSYRSFLDEENKNNPVTGHKG